MAGSVKEIYLCAQAGGQMNAVHSTQALAGQGLEGDRYAAGVGFYSDTPTTEGARQLTLIEHEALEAVRANGGIELSGGDARRNIVTIGVRLPDLLGKRFSIGDAVCEGVRDCPPCNHLEELTGKSLMRPLVRSGGLRARVVAGGVINAGDPIEIIGESQGPTHPEKRA